MAIRNNEENNNERLYVGPRINRLTLDQIKALDKELEAFKIKVKTDMFGEVEYVDEWAWLKHRGALDKYGSVVVTGYQPPKYNSQGQCTRKVDCEPILYEQLCEDFRQWSRWSTKYKHNFNSDLNKKVSYQEIDF